MLWWRQPPAGATSQDNRPRPRRNPAPLAQVQVPDRKIRPVRVRKPFHQSRQKSVVDVVEDAGHWGGEGGDSSISLLVRLGGLEPPTKSLGNFCSIHLSYSRRPRSISRRFGRQPAGIPAGLVRAGPDLSPRNGAGGII